MKPDTKKFTCFFPNAEKTPFSDMEACNILGISNARFNRAIKLGLIQKSVGIHYRLNISFKFMNIFDIFEYALRRDFFFLNYGYHPEVNELVCSLVDEFASIIDNCIYTSKFPQIDSIKQDIKISCMDNAEKWNGYWLHDGDPFSSTKCTAIALQSWNEIFRKTMRLISPLPTAEPKPAKLLA